MWRTFTYSILAVFAERPLEGNPLAVFHDAHALSGTEMQALARETNLAETAFILPCDPETEQRDGVRVRIFTTAEELNFAGHPTLGTASVLRLAAPEVAVDNTIRLRLNVGTVPVRFRGEGLDGEMTQPDPAFGAELDRAEVARLLGLKADDLDPALAPQIVSTGTPFAIVVLRNLEPLGRLKVNQDEASPWLRGWGARWFYLLAPDPDQNQCPTQWRARMQFNGGEDPATGSAAGCAISYLVARGAAPSGRSIHLRQGIEIGRPSDLHLAATLLDARVTDVRVGGSTVLVATGRLFLP